MEKVAVFIYSLNGDVVTTELKRIFETVTSAVMIRAECLEHVLMGMFRTRFNNKMADFGLLISTSSSQGEFNLLMYFTGL